MRLILASSSPFRQMLLAKLQLPFEAQAPEIDEQPQANEPPESLVMRLGSEKANAIARVNPDAWVIGSDQVAFHRGQIIGKPGSRAAAIEQLLSFSGQTVNFYTSVVLVSHVNNIEKTAIDVTAVKFRKLTRQQVTYYIDTEQPLGCAGSFKSEGLGVALFDSIHTEDPNALIGLPLIKLVQLMTTAGIDPLCPKANA
ncbi:MAG: septum formation inhibitor Maf [Gammaproteobacteria bacterium]|nr:MAG: septum formation inhibitor Maf [Gammaproteobacteria bacterium]